MFSCYLCSFTLPSEAHELDSSYGQNLEPHCRPVKAESGLLKKIPQVTPYVYLSLGSGAQIISNSTIIAFQINKKALHRTLAIKWFPLSAHADWDLTLDSACRGKKVPGCKVSRPGGSPPRLGETGAN